MSIAKWHSFNRIELQELAQEKGIPGVGRLSKDALISALDKHAKTKAKPKTKPKPTNGKRKAGATQPHHLTNGAAHHDESSAYGKSNGTPSKDIAAKVGKDRIVCMVRDPYWLHAYWELTRQVVQRAEAALGQYWHGSKPILRLVDVTPCEHRSTVEDAVRDIEIHGGCNNWYIEAPNPPRSYRVDIGYLASNGQLFTLGRSNIVTTPRPGMSDAIDANWADLNVEKASKIYAMSGGFDPGSCSLELKQLFEERLRRPIGSAVETGLGPSACMFGEERHFSLELNAELIVFGSTDPKAIVTLENEPIKLRKDGTFTVRLGLPEGRQVFTALSVSADGVDERKVVLAVERNTRQLEPKMHELDE